MKTGIFGGSFNPVHQGHVDLAKAFVEALQLDRLLVIPSGIPPHKQVRFPTPGEKRMQMCLLAFAGVPQAEVLDLEIRREGASYTCETLRELHFLYPQEELYLLMGADMFTSLDSWREPETIFRLAVLCGIPRDREDAETLRRAARKWEAQGAKTVILDVSIMAVSSTLIRQRISRGETVSGLLPPAVEAYVYENGLYRLSQTQAPAQ